MSQGFSYASLYNGSEWNREEFLCQLATSIGEEHELKDDKQLILYMFAVVMEIKLVGLLCVSREKI